MTQDDKHHGAPRTLSDGVEDHLEPLTALDPAAVTLFDDLLRAMSKTAFSGRALGEAADDPPPRWPRILRRLSISSSSTLSGAMTVAKMSMGRHPGMIEAGLAHAVVSTGALMAHGLLRKPSA